MTNISYIVATLNCVDRVSVLADTAAMLARYGCEILVADGGSADGTVERLADISNVSLICSQSDDGIYNAWNRALGHVAPGYVGFLGIDDRPGDDFLRRVRHLLRSSRTHPKVIYGDRVLRRWNKVRYLKAPRAPRLFFAQRPSFDIPHQGCLHSSELFRENRFDSTYMLAGDFKFMLEHADIQSPSDILYIPTYQVVATDEGLSRSPTACSTYLREYRRIESELGVAVDYSRFRLHTLRCLGHFPPLWLALKYIRWLRQGHSVRNDTVHY